MGTAEASTRLAAPFGGPCCRSLGAAQPSTTVKPALLIETVDIEQRAFNVAGAHLVFLGVIPYEHQKAVPVSEVETGASFVAGDSSDLEKKLPDTDVDNPIPLRIRHGQDGRSHRNADPVKAREELKLLAFTPGPERVASDSADGLHAVSSNLMDGAC
jgi:hypothetical protein